MFALKLLSSISLIYSSLVRALSLEVLILSLILQFSFSYQSWCFHQDHPQEGCRVYRLEYDMIVC